MDAFRQEIVVALRSLRRSPAFAVAAMLSLALAIGAAASAFSVIDAIRFRAIPFADSDRLVLISELPVTQGIPAPVSSPQCQQACDVGYVTFSTLLDAHSFSSIDQIAAHQSGGKAMTRNGDTELLTGTVTTPGLFAMVRATAVRGRLFGADDNRLGAEPVVLLSHDLWTTRFGADPAIIGTPLQLSDTRYTVVGIMPQGFDFESGARFWLPIVPALDPSTRPSIRTVAVIGHLAPGATIKQLQAELATIEPVPVGGVTGSTRPATRLSAMPLRTRYEAATQGRDIIFAAIVACVLLIAGANLTNLMLVHAFGQQREMAVRMALGAGAWRVVWSAALQNILLVLAGTGVGLALARWLVAVLRAAPTLSSFRPTGMEYAVDDRVVGFALLVAAVAAFVMSLASAAIAKATSLQNTLREGAPSGGTGAGRVRRAFVALQIACAAALLIAAGLEVKTVNRLAQVDLGFDPRPLVVGSPSYPHPWRVRERFVPATREILQAIQGLQGVASAAVRAAAPLSSGGAPPQFTPVGASAPLSQLIVPAAAVAVSPDYFETLGISVPRGRAFHLDDRELSTRVAMINQWAAERWWPNQDAVGQQLRVDTAAGAPPLTLMVVGVARNNRAARPDLVVAPDGPELYVPYDQAPSAFPTFLARASGPPDDLINRFRALLVQHVPDRPASTQLGVKLAETQLAGIRRTAIEVLTFAVIGLALAIVGIYGVVAHAVARRSRELGVRRALGATEGSLRALVVGEALRLAIVGFVIGAGAAYFGARLLAPLLFGSSTRDIAVYAIVGTLVLLASGVAALVPALRAARVSPTMTLRT